MRVATTTTPNPDDDVREHVAAVATALEDRLTQVTAAMRDVLASRIEELNGDARLIDLLGASIEGNVDNILYSLRHGVTVDRIEPPSAAFEYARRLAQRGVPVNALVRAYRLGQQNLLEAAYAESMSRGDDPVVQSRAYEHIVAVTFAYIDWISQHVVSVYEDERERWLADRNTMRTARVEEIIAGEGADLDASEAAIGYRLRGWHLGAVIWVDETGARQDQFSRFTSCLTALTGTANAQTADSTALSLYRSDNPSLYASQGGDVDAGYAVVREQRALTLAAGTHDVTIGNLPNALDAEALNLLARSSPLPSRGRDTALIVPIEFENAAPQK